MTTADLGAWVLKGNADQAGRFAADPHVSHWCVHSGYRMWLRRAGQPVVFWASGSRRNDLAYGIWGLGVLTAPARQDPDDHRWKAPLDLTIAPPTAWMSRRTIRADATLADLKVLRQPQAANPSFLTVAQFTVDRRYLSQHRTGAGEGR
ncbi:hypothetical protein [Actinoplanes sp. NPDC051494]|uniref:hypothetical protein n=1 Tax=Actinoplanes sp. NPDC051494 TaxID=3363907 RepID=UPI0037AF1FEF